MVPVLRVIGIVFVYLVALASWMALGGVTTLRTDEQDSTLRGSVVDLFGGPLTQAAPTFSREWMQLHEDVETVTDARGVATRISKPRWELVREPVAPTGTTVAVDLQLDERRKGLMWYPLYNVGFDGRWTYTHDADVARDVRIRFAFPDPSGQYDEFRFVVDGVDVSRQLSASGGGVEYVLPAVPGQVVALEVHYRARGMSSYAYQPTESSGQIEGFALTMTTDFRDIDFPAGTMSPTRKVETDAGWTLDWTFSRIVTGKGIGMTMPSRLQPGELASALAFSAPIPLGLFFLWVFVLGMLRGIDLHPVNYLFIAAAFISFNLLFAYTADRLPLETAFAVASVVSLFLVASYLRLVVGARFALLEAGLAQLVYQVGFGVAHFVEGFTGLTITVLGILTLFALMQLTGRVRWGQALSAPRLAT